MSITYECPNCQSTRRVAESMAGRRLRCPDCDEMVEVPAVSGPAEDDDSIFDALNDDADEISPGLVPVSAPSEGLTPVDSSGGLTPVAAPTGGLTPIAASGGFDDSGDVYDFDYDDDDDDGADEEEGFVKATPRAEGEMDMTPMVDVTFLLLIFFMVTAAFTLQKSIEIPKPDQTDEPSTNVQEDPEETPDIVTVQIDEYNTFTVLSPDWEKEAPGEMDLLARLRESRQGNSDGIIPSQLLVKAHGECLHRRVVMALDAGSETGFESVQLMTVDGEF